MKKLLLWIGALLAIFAVVLLCGALNLCFHFLLFEFLGRLAGHW